MDYLRTQLQQRPALLLAVLLPLAVVLYLQMHPSQSGVSGTWSVISGANEGETLTLGGIGTMLAGSVTLPNRPKDPQPAMAQVTGSTLQVSFPHALAGHASSWSCVFADEVNLTCTDTFGSPVVLTKQQGNR